MKNKTIDLGTAYTYEFNDVSNVILISKKYLKLNDGKQIEFHVRQENGKIILESQLLTKLSKGGVDNNVKR